MVDDPAVLKNAIAAAAVTTPPPNEPAILEDSTPPTMSVDVPAPADRIDETIDLLQPAAVNYEDGAIDVIELSWNHVEPASNITAAVCYKTLFGDLDIGLVLQWVGTYWAMKRTSRRRPYTTELAAYHPCFVFLAFLHLPSI
jgi:hypothetical protein